MSSTLGIGDDAAPEDDSEVATPLGTASVAAAVRDRIREAILSGRYAPGMRLRQAELTKIYRVSLTPVREALRHLTAEGLLDENPYVGITVHQPTLEEFERINQIRWELIPLAIRDSVAHATQAQLRQLGELLALMDVEREPARWTLLNRRFHQALDSTAHNVHLVEILHRLDNVACLYINLSIEARDHMIGYPTANEEHRAIVDAIARRDVDAGIDLSRRHLHATLEAVRSTLDPGQQSSASAVPGGTAEQ